MPRSRNTASVDLPITLVVAVPDTVAEQILLEALEPLSMALTEHGASASLSLEPSRVTVDMLVSAPTDDPLEGLAAVQPAVQQVLAALTDVLGRGHGGRLISLTVQTEQARDEALAALDEARDLMGIAEIAEWRGQLRQAVQRVTRYARFPRPVATLKAGPVYLRRDVEQFYAREEAPAAARGRSQAGGAIPDKPQRERLAELLHEHLEQHPELADATTPVPWQEGAGRPHSLLEPHVLASAIEALGGPTRAAEKTGVERRQVQRWLVWARGQEGLATTPSSGATSAVGAAPGQPA